MTTRRTSLSLSGTSIRRHRAHLAVLVALVVVVTTVALVAGLLGLSSASARSDDSRGARGATDQVVYYNLGQPEVRPKYLYTAFSSSPTMVVKRWKRWGKATAVGRGHWDSSCASCPPPARRKATVRLTKIETCEDGTRAYTKATVQVRRPDEGETRRTYHLETGCP